jgi:hypothetical protein
MLTPEPNDFVICWYKIGIYFQTKISWVAAFCENFLSRKREISRTSLKLAEISFIACIPRNVSFNLILDKSNLLSLRKKLWLKMCGRKLLAHPVCREKAQIPRTLKENVRNLKHIYTGFINMFPYSVGEIQNTYIRNIILISFL